MTMSRHLSRTDNSMTLVRLCLLFEYAPTPLFFIPSKGRYRHYLNSTLQPPFFLAESSSSQGRLTTELSLICFTMIIRDDSSASQKTDSNTPNSDKDWFSPHSSMSPACLTVLAPFRGAAD